MPELLDEIDDIFFPPAQGKRAGEQMSWEVLRELTPSDVDPLAAAIVPEGAARVLSLKHSHHMLAQALAEGLKPFEASLTTGYDPAYISKLQSDPAFAELVEFYRGQASQRYAEVMDRMKQLGLSVVDELQREFELAPEKWSNREKMELCELMLVKSGHTLGRSGGASGGGAASAPAGGPATLNIRFISAPADPAQSAKVIDVQAADTPAPFLDLQLEPSE